VYDEVQKPSLFHRTCVQAVLLGSKFRQNHEKGQSSKQAINRICNKTEWMSVWPGLEPWPRPPGIPPLKKSQRNEERE